RPHGFSAQASPLPPFFPGWVLEPCHGVVLPRIRPARRGAGREEDVMGTVVVVDDAEVPAIGAQVVLERLGVDAVETPWAGLGDRLPKTSEVDLVLAVVRRDVRH